MGARVLGLVRRAKRLDALLFEEGARADLEAPWNVVPSFTLQPLPRGTRPELWTAWDALASVQRWDATTLEHVLTVLRSTVPTTGDPASEPA